MMDENLLKLTLENPRMLKMHVGTYRNAAKNLQEMEDFLDWILSPDYCAAEIFEKAENLKKNL